MYRDALEIRKRFQKEDVESTMGGMKLGEPLNASSKTESESEQ